MQLVYKLGYNSIYGKTVQHVGYDKYGEDNVGWRPQFHQLLYGGWITSATRATLYEAAMRVQEGIIALATDGIYTLVPIKGLDIGDDLGQWEHDIYEAGTFVQSGVYFLKKEGKTVEHYRGFDKGSLKEQNIIKDYKLLRTTHYAQSTRFMTMGSVIASQERFNEHWCKWETSLRELDLHPIEMSHKRALSNSIIPRVDKEMFYLPFNLLGYNFLVQQGVKGDDYYEAEKYNLPWDKEGLTYTQQKEYDDAVYTDTED